MCMAAVKSQPTRIVIVGGGYVGMYTALGLQKKLRSGEASVTVIDPQPHMTYQPFLPEAAAGSIEPRHVVAPLRKVLKRCHVVTGRVTKIEHSRKIVTAELSDGHVEEIEYDVLVSALGAISRTLPIPGLAEVGIGMKTIGEAIYVRNHVLSRLDQAASTNNADLRKKLLSFVVIGGGFAGIETLAELEDMTRYALRYYEGVKPEEMNWVLVEAMGRIMPEVSAKLGAWTVEALEKRGIKIYLDTRVKSLEGGHVILDDGTEFDSDTIIWTAGMKANPVLRNTDLPLDERGRVRCTAAMQVQGLEGVWAAGDCSAVPDLSRTEEDPTATCVPNAQHAIRQSKLLSKNIVAQMRGQKPKDYFHKYLGSVAGLGLYKGVADVFGLRFKGVIAWFMHRTYHVMFMPTVNRKLRVLMDWTQALFYGREVVALGQINDPKSDFDRAVQS
jgi:NADH dehydrogenase